VGRENTPVKSEVKGEEKGHAGPPKKKMFRVSI
jgi:hypothetical protein